MKQLFLVLLLLMFVSTSVFAEGLGVYAALAALQQANSRTITNEVNISFLSSHDIEDDGVPDWLAPLLLGLGGTGLAVLGTVITFSVGAPGVPDSSGLSPGVRDLFTILVIPGSIAGLIGFSIFFDSIF